MRTINTIAFVVAFTSVVNAQWSTSPQWKLDPGITANTADLVGYSAGGYKAFNAINNFPIFEDRKHVDLTGTMVEDFGAVDFDDSNFTAACPPYGNNGCGLYAKTYWPSGTSLFVRKSFFVPAGATNLRVMASVDNDIVSAWVNGSPIISAVVTHDQCATKDEFRLDIPAGLIVAGQDNLIAFHVRDNESMTYFDLRILAEVVEAYTAPTLACEVSGVQHISLNGASPQNPIVLPQDVSYDETTGVFGFTPIQDSYAEVRADNRERMTINGTLPSSLLMKFDSPLYESRMFFQFDVSSLAGKKVQSATFGMYRNGGSAYSDASPRPVNVYALGSGWNERTLCNSMLPVIGTEVVATGAIGNVNKFVEIDVTTLAQTWIDVSNNGMAVRHVVGDSWWNAIFATKEHTNAALRPYLHITLAAPTCEELSACAVDAVQKQNAEMVSGLNATIEEYAGVTQQAVVTIESLQATIDEDNLLISAAAARITELEAQVASLQSSLDTCNAKPPVEVVKEVIVEVPVEVIVEKIVEVKVPVEVIKEVIVEKIVEVQVPVEVIKEVVVVQYVDKIVEVKVPVEVIVEKIVIKEVPVIQYVDRIVEVIKYVEVPVVVSPTTTKVKDDNGHGNDVGKIDPSNPGKSATVKATPGTAKKKK